MNGLCRSGGWLLQRLSTWSDPINVSGNASFTAKIQWRAYMRPSPTGFKIRETKFSYPSLSNGHSISSSAPSSSLSNSRSGFIGWYLRKLDACPFITKSVTSSLIYAAADLTSQMITMSSPGSFDLIRTTRMSAYGLLILGPSQHLWFNYMSRILPKRDILATVKKIFLGQAVYGPIITTVFFSYNASLQGETRGKIAARLTRDLLPTLINGLKFWPVCDFLTYKFVPVHLQPLINSSFAYLWTIYLTYMASLKGVNELVIEAAD